MAGDPGAGRGGDVRAGCGDAWRGSGPCGCGAGCAHGVRAAMTRRSWRPGGGRPYPRGMDGARQRHSSDPVPMAVGARLREWRNARHLSQLDLALAADVSARHLSCIETGKSRPGRELLARLADALELPLRERNALLLDAGFAPQFPETALGAPVLARIDQAIDAILAQQSPYPAFLINRRWDVLRANDAAMRVNRLMLGGRDSAHANIMRQFFDPADL